MRGVDDQLTEKCEHLQNTTPYCPRPISLPNQCVWRERDEVRIRIFKF